MNRFLLFSKQSCGPCALVDKYFKGVKDERINLIEKVDLDDFSDEPIPQENIDLAKYYGVTATPVLIITSPHGLKMEEFVGGMAITQNIRTMLKKHGPPLETEDK
jgi:thiol-disulfide isomerase/thioredoxin